MVGSSPTCKKTSSSLKGPVNTKNSIYFLYSITTKNWKKKMPQVQKLQLTDMVKEIYCIKKSYQIF